MEMIRKVQVWFKERTDFGELSDCLYYPERSVPSEEQILADAQRRVDGWVELLRNPPKPTEEQLIAEKELLVSEKNRLRDAEYIAAKIAELTTKIAEKDEAISIIQNNGI